MIKENVIIESNLISTRNPLNKTKTQIYGINKISKHRKKSELKED